MTAMTIAENQIFENTGLIQNRHRLAKARKKRMLNAGVTLNVAENKWVKKLTSFKMPPNLECCRKIKYLSARTLNVIEIKGDRSWTRCRRRVAFAPLDSLGGRADNPKVVARFCVVSCCGSPAVIC
jgi:hypothetical protein